MFSAFLTGSRAYGVLHAESDIDVVVPCTQELADLLIAQSDLGRLPCKYGKLNLILVTSPLEYVAWLNSTKACADEFIFEDYDKQRATAIHEEWRGRCGVPVKAEWSGGAEDVKPGGPVACHTCDGRGWTVTPGTNCLTCNGSGIEPECRECAAAGIASACLVGHLCYDHAVRCPQCSQPTDPQLPHTCPGTASPCCACRGTGYYLGARLGDEPCPECNGLGTVSSGPNEPNEQTRRLCHLCNGTGVYVEGGHYNPCPVCRGTGAQPKPDEMG